MLLDTSGGGGGGAAWKRCDKRFLAFEGDDDVDDDDVANMDNLRGSGDGQGEVSAVHPEDEELDDE